MTINTNTLGQEVLAQAEQAVLGEYGIRGGLAADYWKINQGCRSLAVGLDNCDSQHVLLALLRKHPQEIIEGCRLAAAALGTKQVILHLPDGEGALGQALAPMLPSWLKLELGRVEVHPGDGTAFHHVETVYALALLASGKPLDGRHLAVQDGQALGPLQLVPFGTPLSALVSGSFKALAVGARLLTPAEAEAPLVWDTSVAGGVVEVLREDCCIVKEAVERLEQSRQLCCGRCVFCREGMGQLHDITWELAQGKGNRACLSLMAEISQAMPNSTLCSVGQQGGAFTLDALRLFKGEYESHLKKKCPAGVCLSTETVYIDPRLCVGCGDCVDVCPADAIEGRHGYIHMIDPGTCTQCMVCQPVCPEEAVVRTAGKVPKLPTRPVKCGKFRK